MIHFFQTHLLLFTFFMIVLGLCIGSFLNVVVYRLPQMLSRQWANSFPLSETDGFQVNLFTPRSHCPHCKESIPFYLNVPLLGYFITHRKCHFCHQNISLLYPLIELITVIFTGIVTYTWGFSWETLGALIFTWLLIPLIFIDIKHQLLPDALTLVGVWLGLSFNLFDLFIPIKNAVIGAVAGYMSLWLLAHLFKMIRKQEGMGYGDFKLFAMLGAWQGWENLPIILLQASLLGLCISLILLFSKKHKFNTPIPFGPYLAISGWNTLFFKENIMLLYQSLFRFILE